MGARGAIGEIRRVNARIEAFIVPERRWDVE
jgi:hypothetical protein